MGGTMRWLRDRYRQSKLLQSMGDFLHEYGPAWVVAVQVVGWVCFFILWGILLAARVDAGKIGDYFGVSEYWHGVLEEFGLPAAAYLLNRVIFPLRFVMEVLLVRRIHVRVNAAVGPYWDMCVDWMKGWSGWDVEAVHTEESGGDCEGDTAMDGGCGCEGDSDCNCDCCVTMEGGMKGESKVDGDIPLHPIGMSMTEVHGDAIKDPLAV